MGSFSGFKIKPHAMYTAIYRSKLFWGSIYMHISPHTSENLYPPFLLVFWIRHWSCQPTQFTLLQVFVLYLSHNATMPHSHNAPLSQCPTLTMHYSHNALLSQCPTLKIESSIFSSSCTIVHAHSIHIRPLLNSALLLLHALSSFISP